MSFLAKQVVGGLRTWIPNEMLALAYVSVWVLSDQSIKDALSSGELLIDPSPSEEQYQSSARKHFPR